MTNHDLHRLTVMGIRHKSDQDPIILALQDEYNRPLDIYIGPCEALAIDLCLRGKALDRPYTHDLMLSLAEYLDAPVERVVIDDVSKGIYYARLILTTPDGPASLDCRPSDGIAIALRARVPIEASERVMLGENETEE